ncbi:hypothetical protein [Haloarchaeobius sp. TZWSO28]|uniref:hypothetical protein n=1 Tax=Haloarchaeobius sp. TZWSO28 TaxID=3446119 RepID=UPI003EC11C71
MVDWPSARGRRAASAGLAFSIAAVGCFGLLLSLLIALESVPERSALVDVLSLYLDVIRVVDLTTTVLISAVSTFVVGSWLWYSFDPAPGARYSGAGLGGATVLLAHLLFGPAFSLWSSAAHYLTGGSLPGGLLTVTGVLDALVAVFLVSGVASSYSLVVGAWLTLPAGVLTGWLVATLDDRVGLFRVGEHDDAGR